MTPPPPVLAIRGAVARRGSFTLGPVTLVLPAAQTTCLVGPNGAGKTTLVDLVLGLRALDTGTIAIADEPIDHRGRTHLERVGHVPDDPKLLVEELTAHEYWALLSSIRRRTDAGRALARAAELADRLQLDPRTKPISAYSHGMRKKAQLVAALMHEPDLLVVDELRNGLDPISGRIAEELVEEAQRGGAAVLLASHDLYAAERSAGEIVVLDRGRVLATGRPDELRSPADRSLEDAFIRIVTAP